MICYLIYDCTSYLPKMDDMTNYVIQAYAQAPIKCDLYMELPSGIKTNTATSRTTFWSFWLRYVVNNKPDKYGISKEWILYKKLDFSNYKSTNNLLQWWHHIYCPCRPWTILNDDDPLTCIINQLKDSGLNIKDQEHSADDIGVNIKRTCNGSYNFTQHTLIDAIINDINVGNSYTKPVQSKVSIQLHTI